MSHKCTDACDTEMATELLRVPGITVDALAAHLGQVRYEARREVVAEIVAAFAGSFEDDMRAGETLDEYIERKWLR